MQNGTPVPAPRPSGLRTILGRALASELDAAASREFHPDGAEFLAQEAAAIASVADYLADQIRDTSRYDSFQSALFIAYRDMRLHAARRLREARYACPTERVMIRHEYLRIHQLNASE